MQYATSLSKVACYDSRLLKNLPLALCSVLSQLQSKARLGMNHGVPLLCCLQRIVIGGIASILEQRGNSNRARTRDAAGAMYQNTTIFWMISVVNEVDGFVKIL